YQGLRHKREFVRRRHPTKWSVRKPFGLGKPRLGTRFAVRRRVETVKTGVGAVAVILVITGIAGTIYKLVAPDGWIIGAFGRSVSAGLVALGAFAAVVAFAWLS